jgi:hypothetical protein
VACRTVAAVVGKFGERAAVVAAEGEGRRKALVLLATKSAKKAVVLRVLLIMARNSLFCVFMYV